jgi:hypothetical protein
MHGGKIYLRSDCKNVIFPKQVHVHLANKEEIIEIGRYVLSFCAAFDYNIEEIMNHEFTVVEPDSKNPFKQMYVTN